MKETIPQLPPNALRVLERRYLRKDAQRNVVETPARMFARVAGNVAQADALYDPRADVEATAQEFDELMASLGFLPNTPTLMNAGRELQQLSACFVLPIEDSLLSVFETLKEAALIHHSGGGTGFDFSRVRPRGDLVRTTSGLASGPISFLTIYDAATSVIKQGGTRRGANMGILRFDHPDIWEFLAVKRTPGAVSSFNLSVAVTDDFMRAVEEGREIGLVNPRDNQVVQTVAAGDLLDRIVENAWAHGEPGMIFLDRINRDNPTPQLGPMTATNPCGEQPLLPYESCNLGSLNLRQMLSWHGGRAVLDYDRLARTIRSAVHFLDNVIDVNSYPLPAIDTLSHGNRKIGLGVMGLADTLIELGIPYDSEEALDFAEELMRFFAREAHAASADLARERGVFPNYSGSKYEAEGGPRLRNATVTTVAPTGSISIIANCSSGIEPVFALSYFRRILEGEELVEVHPVFLRLAKEHGFYSEDLMRKVAERGTVQDLREVPADLRRVLVTALEIAPEWHVRMQAVFQRYVDNAVSKTVNFPTSASKEDVRKVFMLAYQLGCKGVTVYRYGSRDRQVLNLNRACPTCTWDGIHTEPTVPPTSLRESIKASPGS
ncbi:MAG: adenosylcobalamin-dependent ribonucleoside-diphosphate reductase [Dehalococcoidales bacterium]|nr:adenosylcobalamin-dependent ribonucleoside-diphosphate reductase [Dehalococcoidales bacterium]